MLKICVLNHLLKTTVLSIVPSSDTANHSSTENSIKADPKRFKGSFDSNLINFQVCKNVIFGQKAKLKLSAGCNI